MKLLLPLVLAAVGTSSGIGAAVVLGKNEKPHEGAECVPPAADAPDSADIAETPPPEFNDSEFVKLSNQFLIPVLSNEEVNAMVVVSLSIEVEPGATSAVFQLEPKIRSKFLQILFDHSNKGYFSKGYTHNDTLDILRDELTIAAKEVTFGQARDVLITEIAKQ